MAVSVVLLLLAARASALCVLRDATVCWGNEHRYVERTNFLGGSVAPVNLARSTSKNQATRIERRLTTNASVARLDLRHSEITPKSICTGCLSIRRLPGGCAWSQNGWILNGTCMFHSPNEGALLV